MMTMEQRAREWAMMTTESRGEVADTILAIRDGYRCEAEDVPADIEAWAEANRADY